MFRKTLLHANSLSYRGVWLILQLKKQKTIYQTYVSGKDAVKRVIVWYVHCGQFSGRNMTLRAGSDLHNKNRNLNCYQANRGSEEFCLTTIYQNHVKNQHKWRAPCKIRHFKAQQSTGISSSNMPDTIALRKRKFWICVGGEFFATTMFVFLVCGSTLEWSFNIDFVLRVSVTAGLSIATLAMTIGHLSGGLINPVVSIALMATRKISILEGVFYTLAQFLGGR